MMGRWRLAGRPARASSTSPGTSDDRSLHSSDSARWREAGSASASPDRLSAPSSRLQRRRRGRPTARPSRPPGRSNARPPCLVVGWRLAGRLRRRASPRRGRPPRSRTRRPASRDLDRHDRRVVGGQTGRSRARVTTPMPPRGGGVGDHRAGGPQGSGRASAVVAGRPACRVCRATSSTSRSPADARDARNRRPVRAAAWRGGPVRCPSYTRVAPRMGVVESERSGSSAHDHSRPGAGRRRRFPGSPRSRGPPPSPAGPCHRGGRCRARRRADATARASDPSVKNAVQDGQSRPGLGSVSRSVVDDHRSCSPTGRRGFAGTLAIASRSSITKERCARRSDRSAAAPGRVRRLARRALPESAAPARRRRGSPRTMGSQ